MGAVPDPVDLVLCPRCVAATFERVLTHHACRCRECGLIVSFDELLRLAELE